MKRQSMLSSLWKNEWIKRQLKQRSEKIEKQKKKSIHGGMIQRCINPNHNSFKRYGGRGIKVYLPWRGKDGFRHFLRDVGERPTLKHQLHRLNNDGNYEPGNVIWSIDHSETY